MRVVLYLNIPSPHQFPIAEALARILGHTNVLYVYAEAMPDDRLKMGWGVGCSETLSVVGMNAPQARDWLETADVMLTGMRDLDLFGRRGRRGLRTFYASERWFKPRIGRLRMLHPAYRRMAWRFISLVKNGSVTYLPCGIWAARDMAWLCLRGAERRTVLDALAAEDGAWRPMQPVACDWMRMWGYFVAPSEASESRQADARPTGHALRVLWAGRLLAWKRVDTLFKAASACLEKIPLTLTVVGDGPERARLETQGRRLFAGHPDALDFRHSVPIGEVRALMRAHDVYVLPSNGYEGWGAVVSEALEEGMVVLGTFEAGSSATVLPTSRLFHAGDWRRLARLLDACRVGGIAPGIGAWSAASAAEAFVRACCERGV